MKAVWSFWTKPFTFHHKVYWTSARHHLFSWVISVETAKRHYSETALYTDDEGATLLVDRIGLEFDLVSTDLNALREHNPEWWMLGKLYTYRAQTTPFVHLDSDVFLWEGLPESLQAASIFAQSLERFSFEHQLGYQPLFYESAINAGDGWLPQEWYWYTSLKGDTAVDCGILGANKVEFLTYYADQAIKLIEHPANQMIWHRFNLIPDNILFEQYLLSAFIEYYRQPLNKAYDGIRIDYLFDLLKTDYVLVTTWQDPKFTHLIGRAKSNPITSQRLEEYVRCHYPDYYRRIIDFDQSNNK